MVKDKLLQIIESTLSDEHKQGVPQHTVGSKNQRKRIKEICEFALKNHNGDILEIGAYIGLTTKILCELAKTYGRKVYVIDPWDGVQNGGNKEYDEFLKNTQGYEDILIIKKQSSLTNDSRELIRNNQFAFCFVDGLHTVDACDYDIESCITQKGIISVDDTSWCKGLDNLIYKHSKNHQKNFIVNKEIRESYIF